MLSLLYVLKTYTFHLNGPIKVIDSEGTHRASTFTHALGGRLRFSRPTDVGAPTDAGVPTHAGVPGHLNHSTRESLVGCEGF